MKNLIKDRKTLSLVLCIVVICVFTLTVAYSALSAVLTISGNARVSAADWDIYLNNPRVTSGSATTDVPVIKTSSTLEFETTLNMPGDFYEFVVDVVNAGDIDAMIENVVKTPELTAEQAKFLKYEVSYQNGESITTKQLLAKDTTMPIKVRVEYRKDLNNSDLPTGQIVLDLALTLEYTQSDGTGSSVKDDGVDLYAVGMEKCFGSECFYIISSDDDTVTLFSKYNLLVGNILDENNTLSSIENPTGIQDKSAVGYCYDEELEQDKYPFVGTVVFSESSYWSDALIEYPANVYNFNASIYNYVENYKNYLVSKNIIVNSSRLITLDELENLGCIFSSDYSATCDLAPSWISSSSYWIGTAHNETIIFSMNGGIVAADTGYFTDGFNGVRPVIVISKDYFN